MPDLIQEADTTANDLMVARYKGIDAVNNALVLDVLSTLSNQQGQTKVQDLKPYVDEVNSQLSKYGVTDLKIEQSQDGHIIAHEKVNGTDKTIDVSEDRIPAFKRFEQAANLAVGSANDYAKYGEWKGAYTQYHQAADLYMKAWSKVPAWDEAEQQHRQQIMESLNRADLTCRVQGGGRVSNMPIRWNLKTSDN